MQQINFNKDWRFIVDNELDSVSNFGLQKYGEATGAVARFYDFSHWKRVDLPHDWAVALPKDPFGDPYSAFRPNTHSGRNIVEGGTRSTDICNVGWYRKQFFLGEEYEGKRIFIEFEGVFRDSIVWINGIYLDRHASGYGSFIYELTDHVYLGEDNSITVRVDSDLHEGWWYEGAGIYRNVFLHVAPPVYIKLRKTVIKADVDGTAQASVTVVNDTDAPVCETLVWKILDRAGNAVATAKTETSLAPWSEARAEVTLRVNDPKLWSVEEPNLYTLSVEGSDHAEEAFGFRSIRFDANEGFFLNGKPVKLCGACVHHDFGGVGVALTDNLQRYKIQLLKEMGVNAYRSSHNAPAPALLRACDELGMLVMDESRMFGTAPDAIRELQALVERDRNHPSVIIWSIGNEEFTVQNLPRSRRVVEKATRLLKQWDDTRPVTYAGNNGANFDGANGAAEVRGVNYIQNGQGGFWLDEYHKEHPHQPIVGSEESSYVLSRGSVETDLGSGLLDCMGNVVMIWGATPKGWTKYMSLRPYFAGSFMWTGFDYRGEPTPFSFTNGSSSFGTIDLCGMPKPPFYYYRANWTNEPVLKLAPHWNYREGEEATVAVYTNCESVSLTLNGKSVGTYTPAPYDNLFVKIPFEAGVLRAEGVRAGKTYTDELVTAGKPVAVRCKTVLYGESDDDVSIVEICAVDAEGRFCPLADDVVSLTLDEGEIIGVGNGDPADLDYEQKPEEEEIRLIRTFDCGGDLYSVPPKSTGHLVPVRYYMEEREVAAGYHDDRRHVSVYKNTFEGPREAVYTTRVSGVERFEYLEFECLNATVKVFLNGEELGDNLRANPRHDHTTVCNSRPYRFDCHFTAGVNEIRVEASLINNNYTPFSGYVKLGRRLKSPWNVHLHYGLARAFLKTNSPDSLAASLRDR